MRRQFRIDPRQVEHRCDLADGMIIRHGVSKAERIEKLPLILVEPPHHCAPPQKTVLQTRNHRSTHASTDFCNKICQDRTFLGRLEWWDRVTRTIKIAPPLRKSGSIPHPES